MKKIRVVRNTLHYVYDFYILFFQIVSDYYPAKFVLFFLSFSI